MNSRRSARAGWRGIGVDVTYHTEGSDEVPGGFLAVANDAQDGQPAVSVWANPDTWGRREAAFWMTPEGARRLALSLLALAERAESQW